MAARKSIVLSNGVRSELPAADWLDFTGTQGVRGLSPSTTNGQPLVHQQLGAGFNPNVILSNWAPGAPVSNSSAEVPVFSFQIGGTGYQQFTQWEIDAGFSVLQNSPGTVFGNFFLYFNGVLIASNQNNDNPMLSTANQRAGLIRIKIVALSDTQIGVSVLLRLGLGATVDLIDKGNVWDHTGEFVITVPSLTTARTISATVQSETADSGITITPGFGSLIEIRPIGSVPAIPPSYPIRSGTVITIATNEIAPGTQSLTPNVIRAAPWLLQRATTISQIRQEISTAGTAGATIRLSLYADDGAGYPGQLVANSDTGALDSATVGVKLYTPPANIVLQPGLYWLAINTNLTSTIRALPAAGISPVLGVNPAGGTNSHYTAWTVNFAYAAMPATFPAGAARIVNINAPWTMFTVA